MERRSSFEVSAQPVTRWIHWSVIVWLTEGHDEGKQGVNMGSGESGGRGLAIAGQDNEE
jgi:hypothetical protein